MNKRTRLQSLCISSGIMGRDKYIKPTPFLTAVLMAAVLTFLPIHLWAESGIDGQTDLAKKLANPIANLISIPIQANYDENIGPAEDGSQWRVNIQPVIPLSIGENWNLITRTILPLIDQNDIPVSGQGESGLGDIVASQFFSPTQQVYATGWMHQKMGRRIGEHEFSSPFCSQNETIQHEKGENVMKKIIIIMLVIVFGLVSPVFAASDPVEKGIEGAVETFAEGCQNEHNEAKIGSRCNQALKDVGWK